ncbi:MAG: hemolysin family protein [Bacteroidales bacterium]
MTELTIIAILILFNGMLSMSEIALISARKSYLSAEAKKGNKAAQTALQLVNEPNNFLSTVQIGITIIGILTGIYSGSTLAAEFSGLLIGWGVSQTYAHTLAQVVIVVFVTYLTLVMGELLPKRIGMSIAEKVVKRIARPMYFLSVAATPFVWILSKSTAWLFAILGLEEQQSKVTEEEIKSMIQESTEDGEVQEVEQDIVERVFMLGDLKVSSLMTHRTEITWLNKGMSAEQVREVLENNLYELYPVAGDNLDSVCGVITLKKLVLLFHRPQFNLSGIIEPATFFHENLSVYKALERMKQERISQALICDEFGSLKGIVTLKDILEGLVGSMNDLQTEPQIMERENSEGWLVDGQCPFYDFLAYFETEYHYANHNYNTISGLLLDQLEHIPHTGESLLWEGFKFEVIDMDGARIDKILVTKQV